MGGKSTLDDATEAKVLALARLGGSARSIARQIGGRLGKTRIAEIVAEARAGAGKGPEASRATPTRPEPQRPAKGQPGGKDGPSQADPSPGPGVPPSSEPPASDLEAEATAALDAADRAYDRLDALHAKLTSRVDQELALPAPDLRTLAGVSKLMLEVVATLARTRPPIALRPEDDPTNLAAAEALVERMGKLVADGRRAP